MSGKIVRTWNTEFEEAQYRCEDCNLKVYYSFPIDGDKGAILIEAWNTVCPACSSIDKEPTKKLTEEELGLKKAEIKDRLKCNHNWVMDGHNAGDPICSKCYSRE